MRGNCVVGICETVDWIANQSFPFSFHSFVFLRDGRNTNTDPAFNISGTLTNFSVSLSSFHEKTNDFTLVITGNTYSKPYELASTFHRKSKPLMSSDVGGFVF